MARKVLIGVVVLVVLGAIGATMGGPDGSPTATNPPATGAPITAGPQATTAPGVTVTPAPATPAPATPAPAAFAPIELTGRGDKVVRFTIPETAAAIAEASHRGDSNFAIQSLAEDGSTNDLLVNEIGDYTGTVLFDEGDGEHSVAFQVTADGAWTITVKPVTDARPWAGDAELTGRGDDVIYVSPATTGLTIVAIAHQGESNFAVQSYGDENDLLVNEIGEYSGQTTIPSGTIVLAITADGRWSITPE